MMDPRKIDSPDPNEPSKMPTQAPREDIDWHYNARVAVIFGISQIICGLLCILLGSAAVAVDASHAKIGAGIWGGAVIICAGCVAIWSSRNKTHKAVLVCLVTSLCATVAACLIFIIAGFSISSDLKHVNDTSYVFHFERTSEGSRGYPVLRYNQQILRACIAVHGLMITVAMFEMVAAIMQAVICRYHQCCKQRLKGANQEGELAVIYETKEKTPCILKQPPPGHVISREHPRAVNFYRTDDSNRISEQQGHSANGYPKLPTRQDHRSTSSDRHDRSISFSDHNSVFTDADLEDEGACAIENRQDALSHSLAHYLAK